MPAVSLHRDRIFGLFKAHPEKAFRKHEAVSRLHGISEHVITYWLGRFLKENSLVQPSYGTYQLNTLPAKTVYDLPLEEKQRLAAEAGASRVISTGRKWDSKVDVMQPAISPAVPIERMLLRSILDRMKANPNIFSTADIEFVTSVLPAYLRNGQPSDNTSA